MGLSQTSIPEWTKITKLGLDTSPFIYFVERHPVYVHLVREVFKRIDEGTVQGCSSVITLTEVLVHPKRNGNTELEHEYRDLLRHSRNFELIPIDAAVADLASACRSRYVIRTPDALQIAAVLSAGCEAFLTNDKALKQVKELEVIVLEDYLQ